MPPHKLEYLFQTLYNVTRTSDAVLLEVTKLIEEIPVDTDFVEAVYKCVRDSPDKVAMQWIRLVRKHYLMLTESKMYPRPMESFYALRYITGALNISAYYPDRKLTAEQEADMMLCTHALLIGEVDAYLINSGSVGRSDFTLIGDYRWLDLFVNNHDAVPEMCRAIMSGRIQRAVELAEFIENPGGSILLVEGAL